MFLGILKKKYLAYMANNKMSKNVNLLSEIKIITFKNGRWGAGSRSKIVRL